jgi:hypothetical protein
MSDAHTPITTSRTLQTPRGHRIYTTTRDVPVEFPLPVIGATLAASNFVAGFTDHIILDVSDVPLAHRAKRVTVTHGTVPTGTFTEYESEAYTFPSIYPNFTSFMPGGSRARPRNVPSRVVYEYRLEPGDWLDDPAIWDYVSPSSGPFEVESWLAEAAGQTFIFEDGGSGRVGNYLNPFYIGVDAINDEVIIYDPGELFYVISESAPSASTYASWVAAGTEIMVSRVIGKWYCGYLRRTAWVKAQ